MTFLMGGVTVVLAFLMVQAIHHYSKKTSNQA